MEIKQEMRATFSEWAVQAESYDAKELGLPKASLHSDKTEPQKYLVLATVEKTMLDKMVHGSDSCI